MIFARRSIVTLKGSPQNLSRPAGPSWEQEPPFPFGTEGSAFGQSAPGLLPRFSAFPEEEYSKQRGLQGPPAVKPWTRVRAWNSVANSLGSSEDQPRFCVHRAKSVRETGTCTLTVPLPFTPSLRVQNFPDAGS